MKQTSTRLKMDNSPSVVSKSLPNIDGLDSTSGAAESEDGEVEDDPEEESEEEFEAQGGFYYGESKYYVPQRIIGFKSCLWWLPVSRRLSNMS